MNISNNSPTGAGNQSIASGSTPANPTTAPITQQTTSGAQNRPEQLGGRESNRHTPILALGCLRSLRSLACCLPSRAITPPIAPRPQGSRATATAPASTVPASATPQAAEPIPTPGTQRGASPTTSPITSPAIKSIIVGAAAQAATEALTQAEIWQDSFVNRYDEQTLFNDKLHNIPNDGPALINFYGIAGQGKTFLLKYLVENTLEQQPNLKNIDLCYRSFPPQLKSDSHENPQRFTQHY